MSDENGGDGEDRTIQDDGASVEVFVDKSEPSDLGIGVVLHGASILEDEHGVLAPGLKLSLEQTDALITALTECRAFLVNV